MSKFYTQEVEFTDKECLVKAIKEINKHPLVGEDLPLYGYRGDMRKEKADIVIERKELIGGSNDLGFKFNKTKGKFDMIISEYDRNQRRVTEIVNNIKKNYSAFKVEKEAKVNGFTVTKSKNKDNSIRLNLKRKKKIRIHGF